MNSITEKLESVPKIEDLNKVVQDLKETIEFLSDKYDRVMERLTEAEVERKKQNDTVAKLEQQVKSREEEIVKLQRRMRDTEQYARNRNVEISGVEVQKNEDLKKVMGKIAESINVPYSEQDIDVIHRLPSRRGDAPPKIVAQFVSRTIRNRWLKQKNHGGHLWSSALVPNGTGQTRVYLNTHLTPEWQRLLWLAKQKGRPSGYMVIWFQDSKIIAKKSTADTRAVYIYGDEDLEKLTRQSV